MSAVSFSARATECKKQSSTVPPFNAAVQPDVPTDSQRKVPCAHPSARAHTLQFAIAGRT